MRHLVPFALLAAALAWSAEARPRQEPRANAVIEWGWRPQPREIVYHRVWSCAENRCSGPIAVDGLAAARRSCRSLAQRGHRVLSFETPTLSLDEAELARCNRG